MVGNQSSLFTWAVEATYQKLMSLYSNDIVLCGEKVTNGQRFRLKSNGLNTFLGPAFGECT